MSIKTPKKINLNVKIDPDLKQKADTVFENMGITTSAGVMLFIKRVVDDQELPFTPRVATGVDKALQDLETGNTHSAKSPQQMFDELDGDDD